MSDDREHTPSEEITDDAKAKFREALDRKKQSSGAGPGVGAAKGGQGSTHGKVGGKREFRRKSV